jgi:hypothetical protein
MDICSKFFLVVSSKENGRLKTTILKDILDVRRIHQPHACDSVVWLFPTIMWILNAKEAFVTTPSCNFVYEKTPMMKK